MSSLEEINKAVANIPWKKIGNGTAETLENIPWKKVGIATAVGVTSVYVAAPLVVSGLGFKASGIASTTLAAKMMSSAAIANGGGISATSSVAALQSAGVLGISAKSGLIIGGVTGGATFLSGSAYNGTNNIDVVKDTNCKEVMNDELDGKSTVNGAKEITSDSSSSTYSALQSQYNKTGDMITGAAYNTCSAMKTAGNMTYDLMNKGGSAVISSFTSKPADTKLTYDASDKTDSRSSSYQYVVDGASGVVTGATSYISRVAKMPSSLWSSEATSDSKKEQ